MIGLGKSFPEFSLQSTVSISKDLNKAFKVITNNDFAGEWKLFFFWPKDFTFICPTEIAEFGRLFNEFKERGCQILGVSTDSEFVHRAWREHNEELKNLPFPMIADIKRELCATLGILDPVDGVAQRATYLVDPEGKIRFLSVYDSSTGRNPSEILRTLDALQTKELCPCNWQKGEKVICLAA